MPNEMWRAALLRRAVLEVGRVELARDGVRGEERGDRVGVLEGLDRRVVLSVANDAEERHVGREGVACRVVELLRLEEAAARLAIRDVHRRVVHVELVLEGVRLALRVVVVLVSRRTSPSSSVS